MTDVKLMMQFGTSHLSVEGPEEFVNSMLEKWTQLSASESFPKTALPTGTGEPKSGPKTGDSNPVEKYENVYDEIEGALKIIANIPGANKAAKTRSTALALLFGHHLQGHITTTADAIRDACIDQGCYDSSNFASHLKALKERVAMNTKAGGGYDVKLTAPGRKAAQEFVEHLNNGIA